jgi:hypothetical protein
MIMAAHFFERASEHQGNSHCTFNVPTDGFPAEAIFARNLQLSGDNNLCAAADLAAQLRRTWK